MATVTGFNQLLQAMANADFFTGILPFLLTYIITFLAVQRLPLLKEKDAADKRKFSALISIIIAFFVANFLVQNPAYQAFFSAYLGRIVIGMVGILGFLVLVGLIGWDMGNVKKPLMGAVLIFFAVAAFGLSGGVFAFIPESQLPLVGMTLREMFRFTIESGLIWLIVIGAALYWVTSEGGDSERDLYWWTGATPPSRNRDNGDNSN